MNETTTAAREQALVIFLAAVHVCAPDLADAPEALLAEAPMRPADVWDAAAAGPRGSAIASALSPDQVEQVRRVIEGICRDLGVASNAPRLPIGYDKRELGTGEAHERTEGDAEVRHQG